MVRDGRKTGRLFWCPLCCRPAPESIVAQDVSLGVTRGWWLVLPFHREQNPGLGRFFFHLPRPPCCLDVSRSLFVLTPSFYVSAWSGHLSPSQKKKFTLAVIDLKKANGKISTASACHSSIRDIDGEFAQTNFASVLRGGQVSQLLRYLNGHFLFITWIAWEMFLSFKFFV